MASGEPLDYARPRGRKGDRFPKGERHWQVAEVLSAVLLVILIVGGFVAPFVIFLVFPGSWRGAGPGP